MRYLLPMLCLLAACSESLPLTDDPAGAASGNTATINPGREPVRIGEGGAGFDACGGVGRALRPVPVQAAPFSEAGESDRLAADAQLFVCTRSIDQDWLGVVYTPPGQPELDCGVSSPVERRRGYDGPCRSGWVASNAVRLIAG